MPRPARLNDLSNPPRTNAIDRSSVRLAYRLDEEACVAERLEQARMPAGKDDEARAIAHTLVERLRAHKPAGLDAFLHAYDLGSEEGVALMCLAEALLRIPDAGTADELIHDKLGGPDWADKLGDSASPFVNAATFSLLLTGKVLDGAHDNSTGWKAALSRAVGRLGEPVIRTAVGQAMKILGSQFVFGRDIGEALKHAAPERRRGLSHSFDMLGEAARTHADAARYADAYRGALARIARENEGGMVRAPGISVKLSALHPRYDYLRADEAKATILPILRELAATASAADIHLTIDAEESDRLELQMDLLEALVSDDSLFVNGWSGLGMALQAYAKRAVPVTDWIVDLARKHNRRLMVRLVKGAYWDSEIKVAQVAGYDDYPVFTRKVATDVSFLACAARLLKAPDCIYAAFATHNAATIGAIKAMAGTTPFEFQRLHGMGEGLYGGLADLERELGDPQTPVRIYAPVGSHKELLAYLVRRLLENGANSSFVNRIADETVGVEELTRDPVSQLEALSARRNPAIPFPGEMFGSSRRNSSGVDLSDPSVREPLLRRLAQLESHAWRAAPTITAGQPGATNTVYAPFDNRIVVGEVTEATVADVDAAMTAAAAAQPAWDALGGSVRAQLLNRAADLFEEHKDEFYSLCLGEAGKTLPDALLEVREAVDFLRYYAAEGERLCTVPVDLPGPTGEINQLRMQGRGVWACISPWNFPLAIFIGPVAAALAAGNAALAKPAEQTPLIGALAIELLHQAGIPREIAQLIPGDGRAGAALTAHRLTAGVAFTGSTATAKAINRALADRDGPIIPLIAETGGQNAMIVDSSALPEQVTRDVVASAFQSAGQRCSALRVLFVADEVADTMLTMIAGAMHTLTIGDPRDLTTDVGPVIDEEAKAALDAHVADLRRDATILAELALPPGTEQGSFVAPLIAEIPNLVALDAEHFGPILHVIRYPAGDLDGVIDQINATGFGLTLGLQSRIDTVREHVAARARVGNFYVNRNQIGAVVESQPFGGEGLSGTGPKAGGPNYVPRFATERVTCIDTTAAGGNASLMAAGE